MGMGNPYDNAKAKSFMKTLSHGEALRGDYYLSLQCIRDRLPATLEERYS